MTDPFNTAIAEKRDGTPTRVAANLRYLNYRNRTMTREELLEAVPIHNYQGLPYFVVVAEIPEPWQKQFARALYGSTCPAFPEYQQCAFVWDWKNWVKGKGPGGSGGPKGLKPRMKGKV